MAFRNTTPNRRLNGLYTLAYMGDNPSTPADSYSISRDPTVNDSQGFYIMDMWLNTVTKDVWILVSLAGAIATWVKFSGGAGAVTSLQPDVGAVVNPIAGVIKIHNTDGNVITSNGGTNNLNVNFAPSIVIANDITITAGDLRMPATNLGGSQGVITLGGANFISNWNNTTAVGIGSGNLTSTGLFGAAFGNSVLASLTSGSSDSGFGNGALQSVTSGGNNSAFGFVSGSAITTSSGNSLFGAAAGSTLITGANNTLIGLTAGGAYVGAESNNIIIGASILGTAAESNTTRIGVGGVNATRCFIGGIRGITTGVNDAIAVLVDSAGQLGTVSSSARYKDDIEDMGKDSELLYKLRPVTFEYKQSNSRYKSVGLIAEEVHEVAPRLVVYDEDGRPETVKYHDLVPMLLNELQKLAKRVEELESR